jgi:hypothetical protein
VPAVARARLLLAAALAAGVSVPPALAGEAAGQRVEVEGTFSLVLPAGLERQPAQGIDSKVGAWRGAGIELSYDLGWYSDPLELPGRPDVEREALEIGGRPARLVRFDEPGPEGPRYVVAVHFADLGDGRTRLTLYARCVSPEARERARASLLSLRFTPGAGGGS